LDWAAAGGNDVFHQIHESGATPAGFGRNSQGWGIESRELLPLTGCSRQLALIAFVDLGQNQDEPDALAADVFLEFEIRRLRWNAGIYERHNPLEQDIVVEVLFNELGPFAAFLF
jgi:hypothetical protein